MELHAHCLSLTEDLVFINTADWQKVDEQWRVAILSISAGIQAKYLNNLHSIYLRGSVVQGLQIDYVSDLDIIVVLNDESVEPKSNVVMPIIKENRRAFPFVYGISIDSVLISKVLRKSPIGFYIKTQSICVYGTDVRPRMPEYTLIDQEIVIHCPNIGYFLDKFGNDETRFEHDRHSSVLLIKRILRAGLELVMIRERCYSRDLSTCADLFAMHYPNYKDSIYLLLRYVTHGECLSPYLLKNSAENLVLLISNEYDNGKYLTH